MTLLADLLDALRMAPALPGARCRGRSHLFDEAQPDEAAEVVEQRHAQALGLCSGCTALASCGQWFDGLPAADRPHGVVAGRLHKPRARQRRNTAAP